MQRKKLTLPYTFIRQYIESRKPDPVFLQNGHNLSGEPTPGCLGRSFHEQHDITLGHQPNQVLSKLFIEPLFFVGWCIVWRTGGCCKCFG